MGLMDSFKSIGSFANRGSSADDASRLGTASATRKEDEFGTNLREVQNNVNELNGTTGDLTERMVTAEHQGTATRSTVVEHGTAIGRLTERTTASETNVAVLNTRADDLDRRTTQIEERGAPEDRPITGNHNNEVDQYKGVADEGRPTEGTAETNTTIALRRGNLDRAIGEMRGAMSDDGTIHDPATYRQARDRAGANASLLESAQNHIRSSQETRTLGRRTAAAIWVGSVGGVLGTAGAATTGALIAQNNKRQYDNGN